ncbi:CRISPR-associated endonuclease/helicase Cas3 [Desulfacinum hydrothermale DSM 13146]|uniref:CRISPR-associated endonuclease/helicase Cas3 n=1 Tax=Desulfacinum hydrothermale DSM 13146 TaxID=1121390 RepID=A0A1W1XWN5_9BACT|nr:CRISPR-associated helicase/endonuclease Cas3 [Desulfacinum hydrothermale]SMC27941.1 CRISPR-associated endonuclease/helicase Cas3 [Desulfacinum hydrothermale DSM 13146]
MDYSTFFQKATGFGGPYPYQQRLAVEDWPDLLDVPTGLGKTAGVTLAWLYKRGWRSGRRETEPDEATPRRLIWCLPMRVLVEQTAENIRAWLRRLHIFGEEAGQSKVSVHVLMGGEGDLKTWVEYPEEDMILVGTQDMLLSRALMRGYGMSRYQWPIHFALLHNDCLWAFDEVQLMGAGLPTSAQLEGFRRRFPLSRKSRSMWISATLNKDWLNTVDLRPHLDTLQSLSIDHGDREQAGDRLQAVKHLGQAPVSLTKETRKQQGLQDYIEALCDLVLKQHDTGAQTLVILNRVERAQRLYRLLRNRRREGSGDLLIHARFRAAERAEQARRLREEDDRDRIIVATQAIEAGVDISSKCLITELAPWASLVQRFGRCNRYGEHQGEGASVLWVDIEDDADPLPYSVEALAAARAKLTGLTSASSRDLPATEEPRPVSAVLRRKDLLELFNTDPDLSGFDVDVSDYIRDSGPPGLQVFWRDFPDDPNLPEPQSSPSREELCPVSLGQILEFSRRKDTVLWYWDTLDSRWTRLERDPRPGMTLLLRSADGGYEEKIGFDPTLKGPVSIPPTDEAAVEEGYTDDAFSRQDRPVELAQHLENVAVQVGSLCSAVGETDYRDYVVRAGRWHDLGKSHPIFQATLHACEEAPPGFLAKSPCKAKHERPYFRHELASMLGWLAQHNGQPNADLIAYLIAAHHGKVRMSLRAMPAEEAPAHVTRFARGVWEGDRLPALHFDGEHSEETTLKLALMEIGKGEQGPSWIERTLRLLHEHGPFRLAWLETLVRIADWRASAAEQQGAHGP